MAEELISINIDDLKPHPINASIYGENEDISDLKHMIKEKGKVTALVVTNDNTIVAGHRRWKACKELVTEGDTRFQVLKCAVMEFENDFEVVEYLILDNLKSRQKTQEQKTREAEQLMVVEKEQARLRKLSTLKQNHTDVAEPPPRENEGKARDIVAEKLKFKSGRAVERSIATVRKADKLKEEGRTEDSELIISVLNNSSPSTAEQVAIHIDEMTEEDKQGIMNGEVSPYKVTSRIGKERKEKETRSANNNAQDNKTLTTKARDKPKDNDEIPKSNNDNLLEQIVIARMIFNAAERLRLDTERCLKEVNFYDEADEDSIRIYQRCLEMIDNVRKVIKKKLKN